MNYETNRGREISPVLKIDYGPLDTWLSSVEAAEAMYDAAEEAKRDVAQIRGSTGVSREVMDRPFDI